jgi:hypothetical protein
VVESPAKAISMVDIVLMSSGSHMAVDEVLINACASDRVHTTKHYPLAAFVTSRDDLLHFPSMFINGLPSITASESFPPQPVVNLDNVERGTTVAPQSPNRVDVRVSRWIVRVAGIAHLVVGEMTLEDDRDVPNTRFADVLVGVGAVLPAICGREAHHTGETREDFAKQHFGDGEVDKAV